VLTVAFDPAAAAVDNVNAMLLVHHLNATGNRAQAIGLTVPH
jgi:hypothetical protein